MNQKIDNNNSFYDQNTEVNSNKHILYQEQEIPLNYLIQIYKRFEIFPDSYFDVIVEIELLEL